MPPLLRERPDAVGIAFAVGGPIVLGVVTGVLLGLSEIGYFVGTLVGILGGFAAGLEHDDPLEGFYRGLLGGLLFGTTILVTHGWLDREAKAHLPDPETFLIVITAVFGAVLGALGGRMRHRRGRRAAAAVVDRS